MSKAAHFSFKLEMKRKFLIFNRPNITKNLCMNTTVIYNTVFKFEYISDFVSFWNQKGLLITLLVKRCGPGFIETLGYTNHQVLCVWNIRIKHFCRGPKIFKSSLFRVATDISQLKIQTWYSNWCYFFRLMR